MINYSALLEQLSLATEFFLFGERRAFEFLVQVLDPAIIVIFILGLSRRTHKNYYY